MQQIVNSPQPRDLDATGFEGHIDQAFTQFSVEALAGQYPELAAFSRSGKDGAIDGVADGAMGRTIFEAKYVASTRPQDARQRWKEVSRNLDRNLTPSAGPTESQYQPWYGTDYPIKRYIFCASFRGSLADRDSLRTEIEDFFVIALAKRNHLRHLTELKVILIDWDILIREAAKFPILRFRWFPICRPTGVNLLDATPVAPQSFQAFLRSEHLPFYSRERHFASHRQPGSPEEQLLASLSLQNPGLIISGAGGVGKTRLSLELGRKARNIGWLVFEIRRSIAPESLVEILKHSAEKSVLLVLDYVEQNARFEELADSIAEVNDEAEMLRVAYVATSRPAFYHSRLSHRGRHVRVDLSPLADTPEAESLREYRHACVAWILRTAGLDVDSSYQHTCAGHPVLAAFMLFLRRNGKDVELRELLLEGDFSKWVAKRIHASFASGGTDLLMAKRWLALHLPLLPFSEAKRVELITTDQGKAYFDRLTMDGWVERGADSDWRTLHDVFADQILVDYATGAGMPFVAELIRHAEASSLIQPFMHAIERVAIQPGFPDIEWIRVIDDRLTAEPIAWHAARLQLISTSLLKAKDMARLLERHPHFWTDVCRDVTFQLGLSQRGKELLQNQAGAMPNDVFVFIEWLYQSIAIEPATASVIAIGLRLDASRFRALAEAWLIEHGTELWAQYVLAEWCRVLLPLDAIRPILGGWIARFGDHFLATFVYKAWLDAGGSIDHIRDSLRNWLANHSTNLDAQFLYTAWSKAGGELEFVRDQIVHWLAQHATTQMARFLYASWLHAGGELQVIREPIRCWFEKYGRDSGASFVFRSWLQASGELDIVREPIRRWLEEHGRDAGASFVFRSWLQANGELEVVREPVRRWLEEHGSDPQASFVFQDWLQANGELSILHEPIRRWLEEHELDLNASFVIQDWLQANGELDVVREPIRRWLEEHELDLNASFVFQDWLQANGELDVVREPIRRWLEEHERSAQAPFVFNSWLRAKGELAVVREPIRRWLQEHGRDPHAHFLFQYWLKAKGELEVVREPIRRWLQEHGRNPHVYFLFHDWLKAKGELEIVREPIRLWLEEHERNPHAHLLFQHWLKAKGELTVVWEPILRFLCEANSDEPTSHVLGAWFSAGGTIDDFVDSALKWRRNDSATGYAENLVRIVANQRRLPMQAVSVVLQWCATFPHHPESFSHLIHLGSKLLNPKIAEEVVRASERVITVVLATDASIDTVISTQLPTLLGFLLPSRGPLSEGALRDRVDNLFLGWFNHPHAYTEGISPPVDLRLDQIVARLIILLATNAVNIVTHREAIRRFLAWINRCDNTEKYDALPLFLIFHSKFPEVGLWEVIQVSSPEGKLSLCENFLGSLVIPAPSDETSSCD